MQQGFSTNYALGTCTTGKTFFFQPESSLKIDNSVLGHKHGLTNQGVKSQGRLTTSIFGSEEVCMDLALSIPWALL